MSNSPLQDPPADYFPAGSDNWFSIPEGKDAGKQLFYYDYTTGPGELKTTEVLVRGNPESSYTYRHIRDSLIEAGKPIRIIAMEHIGFGNSDQATCEMVEMVEMHHSKNLLQHQKSIRYCQ